MTSRYIHTVDTALIMAADSIAGYIQGLLDGVAFTHTSYALDRDSRKSALAHFLGTDQTRGGGQLTSLKRIRRLGTMPSLSPKLPPGMAPRSPRGAIGSRFAK